LANSILNTFEHEPVVSDASADTVGDEVAPVLLESHGGRARQAEWLAERIREIEGSLGQVPTLAVFVSDESDVEPLTQELNRQFANDNLQAVACVRGQIIGQDTDVRVFDIRHVKGLEFEAAFFVGIDVLARQLPVDFARYLYVGATRAATYLGITCESGLPESIASLQPQFVSDWIAR
jgi:superfamily I DNA and RNA helicase